MSIIKSKFENYKLSQELIKSIQLLDYKNPTTVQEQVIPQLLEGKDVIVKSHTGSGKTAAFAIPIAELIDWEENKPQVLVITPTRELAIQVKEDFFNIGRFKRLKISALIGKSSFKIQEKELKQKTHVVVGTPGRIKDHIDRGTIELGQIKYLVIDEADEMLNMGFVDQVEAIIKHLNKDRSTMVLSATMPDDIRKLCNSYMNEPINIEIEEQNPIEERISQCLYKVNENKKIQVLKDLITIENPDSAIIFCNTQIKVDEVNDELESEGWLCDRIHGGMEQDDRLKVMSNFKKGHFRYLIATDVAARGIDVDHISLVVNFDVPNSCENYVHRIGRTGRIGNTGRAITLVSPGQQRLLEDIEKYISNKIDCCELYSDLDLEKARDSFIEKTNEMPQIKADKSEKLDEHIMKLHINAGKKTKMRAVDIVGTLCSIDGITADDIGVINIMDVSTFVEILNGKGELVFEILQNKPVKGRLRKVSKELY